MLANGTRDARLWPYPSNSIWNTPLGSKAKLVKFGLKPPGSTTLAAEEDILVATPSAIPRPIFYSPAGWTRGRNRCNDATLKVLIASAPVTPTFTTDPGFFGLTPNHSSAIVKSNGTLIESQPFHACADGRMVSKLAPPGWQGGSILHGDTARKIHPGSHGASGLTAFGGTIRLGEWVPGGVIPHAVKIEVWAARYLSSTKSGYRWPARNADQYSANIYGSKKREARMGALLALPGNFKQNKLKSPAAKVLARTLATYGAYIVGDTKRDTVALATEWGPNGRVLDQFKQAWGFPLYGSVSRAKGAQRVFLKDLRKIYKKLKVVDDNSPKHIGGKGKRLAPTAPPLAPWTG